MNEKGAVMIDPGLRGWLEIKGEDARKFLNGLLTNNIQTLQGKNGCYACLCTAKGKMIADLYCYACGDYFGIDCNAFRKQWVLETLKRYVIFQKVVVEDHSEKWNCIGILGECSKIVPPQKNYVYDEATVEGIPVWTIRKKMWGLEGCELWVKKEKSAELKSRLNLKELTSEEEEILRIESATPKWGVDMDENTIPQEANLYEALSFNKGCYVGQEIIARLEHRGHVGKQLRLLKLEGDAVPAPGEKIFSEDGNEIGVVTSGCFSPKYNAPIALGYIRYAFLNKKEVCINSKKAYFFS